MDGAKLVAHPSREETDMPARKKPDSTSKRSKPVPRGAIKELTVQDSLDRFARETECPRFERGGPALVREEDGPVRDLPDVLKCDVWISYSATRCGLVSDCDTYTYEEFARVARRVADAANDSTQQICNDLGCKRRVFRRPRWSWECERRLLCVTVRVEFMCIS